MQRSLRLHIYFAGESPGSSTTIEGVEEDLPEVDDHHQQRAPSEYDQVQDNAKFLMSLSEGRQLSQVAVSSGCRRICKETIQTVLQEISLELSAKIFRPLSVLLMLLRKFLIPTIWHA